MGFLDSYYDTNHDGQLIGFERARYEEENFPYPGSQVPDLAHEEYEKSLRHADDPDQYSRSADYREHKSADEDSDYDFLDDYDSESEGGSVLDDPNDYGAEDQYWFAPKSSKDMVAACSSPTALEGARLYAYRCYNCEHWDENVSCTCTRSYACDIYDKRSVYECVDDCPPDTDGETCDYFDFRHGDHG